ncbi:MAG TPA: (2Fe-2S)-binding protein [Candidatus Marinimicrobia bacterium]|nr:(2Fe-2S)-binding protein [Candidatus Neomarinimicrobiota bacterium]
MEGNILINGREIKLQFAPDDSLLDTLRNHGFSELKFGCKEGECGACIILLDGKPVNSCQIFTASILNRKITTVKGVGDLHEPHLIQKAFVESGAIQCGYCTPGMVLSAYSLLLENPSPTEAEIKKALDGNLCRCTGYVKIIEGVQLAASWLRSD